jgi:predicted ribosome-associated RNA-binding protein Tma20
MGPGSLAELFNGAEAPAPGIVGMNVEVDEVHDSIFTIESQMKNTFSVPSVPCGEFMLFSHT